MKTQTIKIKNLPNGFLSVISNGKEAIIGDVPSDKSVGLAPPELVLSGLALCKVATIRKYAMSKGIPNVGNIDAELTMNIGSKDNALYSDVKIKISIEGDLSPELKEELCKQADMCIVHRLLQGNWTITEELV